MPGEGYDAPCPAGMNLVNLINYCATRISVRVRGRFKSRRFLAGGGAWRFFYYRKIRKELKKTETFLLERRRGWLMMSVEWWVMNGEGRINDECWMMNVEWRITRIGELFADTSDTSTNGLQDGHFIGTIHSSFITHNQQDTQVTPIISQQTHQFFVISVFFLYFCTTF